MSIKTKTITAVLIASFLWATSPVTGKILLQEFEPFAIAFWRFLFASLFIPPLFFKRQKKFLNNII